MNASSTARRQVRKGHIISSKEVLSCFYFQKQLLEDCQSLSCVRCLHGLPSERVYSHNLPTAQESPSLCTLTQSEVQLLLLFFILCLCQQYYVRGQMVDSIRND